MALIIVRWSKKATSATPSFKHLQEDKCHPLTCHQPFLSLALFPQRWIQHKFKTASLPEGSIRVIEGFVAAGLTEVVLVSDIWLLSLAESTQLRSSNTNSRDATCIEILTDYCREKKRGKSNTKRWKKEAKHTMTVSKAICCFRKKLLFGK